MPLSIVAIHREKKRNSYFGLLPSCKETSIEDLKTSSQKSYIPGARICVHENLIKGCAHRNHDGACSNKRKEGSNKIIMDSKAFVTQSDCIKSAVNDTQSAQSEGKCLSYLPDVLRTLQHSGGTPCKEVSQNRK
jgi:hypothetical protein